MIPSGFITKMNMINEFIAKTIYWEKDFGPTN